MRRRGFNLVEALLSFALFLLVISLFVQGIRQLSRAQRYFEGKSRAFALASEVLSRLATDCQEASTMVVPAPGDMNAYSTLELIRLDPQRWDDIFPTASPTPEYWNPRDPEWNQRVTYLLSEENLRCRTETSGVVEERQLISGIGGLTVQRSGPICIDLRVSLNQDQRILTFQRTVWLPQVSSEVGP